MTPERSLCPRCGAPRSAADPESPCPACLMRLALGPAAIPPAANRANNSSAEQPATAAMASAAAAPSLEELAALFPELEIRELIGRGGMGSVYLARQKSLDRLVALKIIRADAAADPGFAERFAREARALARLNHPNVVTVHDYGERQGTNYLLMEYVKGANVRQILKAGRLDPARALAIVPPICDALQYAHEEGIVHRDIKPENLLVDERGRVKIADFGLAKLLRRSPAEVTLTGDLQTLGTLHYMAPEQFDRPLEVDHRADIYALGVTLYEMLTGELPLGRYALPSHKSSVDARIDEVVLRAMEREPDLRYQSAYDVKSDVVAYSSSPHAFSSSVAAVPAPKLAGSVEQVSPPVESSPTEEHLIPGIALAFVGVLVTMVHGGTFLVMAQSVRGPDPEVRFVALGLALFGLPMILGGVLAARSRGYGFAVFGALTAMLPVSVCFPLSLPIGIWALLVLRKRAVREAFVRQSDGYRSSVAAVPPPHASDGAPAVEPSQDHVLPGMLLAALGIFSAIAHGALCAFLVETDVGQPEVEEFLPLVGVALALPMILGGFLCATSRSIEASWVAAFVSLQPLSLAFPLSIPLGIWLVSVLRRPDVELAFSTQRRALAIDPQDPPFVAAWRALPQPAKNAAHVALAIVYCLGLVCIFSFSGGRTQQDHTFAMGFPTPWLSLYEHENEFTQSISLSWSLLGGLIGLIALFGQQALRRLDGEKPSPLTLHYALWGGMLAFAFWIGLMSIRLHRENAVLSDGQVLIPPPTTPLIIGIVAGVGILVGALIAYFVGRVYSRSPESDVPSKPAIKAEAGLFRQFPGVAVGLVLLAFALFGAATLAGLGYLALSASGSPSAVAVKHGDHVASVRDVAVSRDGRFTISVGDDGKIVRQNHAEGDTWRSHEVRDADGGGNVLRTIAIDPEGAYAYAAGETGTIVRLDLANDQAEELSFRPAGTVQGLAVTRDQRSVSFVSNETDFVVIDPRTDRQLAGAEVYHGESFGFGNLHDVASSPNGELTAVTSSNLVQDDELGSIAKSAEPCRLTIFDQKGQERLSWQFDDYAEFSNAAIAFLDDRTLVAALPSGRLNIWRLPDQAKNPAEWRLDSRRIAPGRYSAAAASFDGKRLWLAHERQIVAIDVETGEGVAYADLRIGERKGSRAAAPIEALAPTGDPLTVVVGCWDGSVQRVTCEALR